MFADVFNRFLTTCRYFVDMFSIYQFQEYLSEVVTKLIIVYNRNIYE